MADYDPAQVEKHELETWESTADVYAEAAGFMTALSGQRDIAVAAGAIGEGSSVLDVGCGPGQLTAALAERAGRVEGIDFSDRMIAAARSAYPTLSFHVANAEAVPFADATFDVAICNYTAHHFARPDAVFSELLRVLEPGGRVVVVHPVQAEQASFGSFAQALQEQLPPEHVPGGPLSNVADPADYARLLRRCGYTNVACDKRVKPVEVDNLDPLLTAGWKIGNLADQPRDIQDKIRAGTIARAETYKTPAGIYSFPDVVIVAVGQRPID